MGYKDPEAKRAYDRAYAAKHKEKIIAYKAVYRESHRPPDRTRRGSPEHRKKKSDIAKIVWQQPGVREKISVAVRAARQAPGAKDILCEKAKNRWKRPDYRAKLTGSKSPKWRGGISSFPYCPKFNEMLKESVREKFGRMCFLSGHEEIGRKLSVHHCDYLKSQGCQGQKWSLLPLSQSWHSKTNFDRWYWFALLRDYWVYKYLSFHGMDIFDGPDRTTWLWDMYSGITNEISEGHI